MTRQKAVAFVVARLSSSRLPAKQLRRVGGKPIIGWIIDNLKTCTELDGIVLATVSEPQNEPLKAVAAQYGIPLFWYEGDVNHVTTRLRLAAQTHGADICLLISADCPLVHGPSIDELIRQLRNHPEADCLVFPPLPDGRACLLEGVQIASFEAWKRADALSDKPELKEHQFPVLYRNPDLFNHVPANLPAEIYGQKHRMSVDTWADMEFMEAIFERLRDLGLPFSLPEAVRLLEDEPELRQINAHVHQRGLIEYVRDVLIIADAGGEFGYGHFMRMRELAGQIVERLSWPVTFLVDDEKAALMAEVCGFHVLWGALARSACPAPSGRRETTPLQASRTHGLAIVDISARRSPPKGWRADNLGKMPLVMIDREDEPASEADMVVMPGATGRKGVLPDQGPRVLTGLGYVILRREISRLAHLRKAKDLDVLTYLYDETQRDAVKTACARNGWTFKNLVGFSEDFPSDMARARVFVSGYGQSFYEALALGAFPVAWPISPFHEADAEAFYAAAGLPKRVVHTGAEVEATLGPIFADTQGVTNRLADKTRAIVEEIAQLCKRHDEGSKSGGV